MMTPVALSEMHRRCPCGCRSLGHDQIRPGWYRDMPADRRAVHDAWLRRELLLWEACVWRPESAEAAAWRRRVALATVQLLDRVCVLLAPFLARAEDVRGTLAVELATCHDRAPPLMAAIIPRVVLRTGVAMSP